MLTGVQIERQIGKGHYGVVYLGDWKGAHVAVKSIAEQHLHQFMHEAAVLKYFPPILYSVFFLFFFSEPS